MNQSKVEVWKQTAGKEGSIGQNLQRWEICALQGSEMMTRQLCGMVLGIGTSHKQTEIDF